VDVDRAVDVIRHAFSRGVNYIDSGFMYCAQESEIAVGRALRGWRDRITLSTKATKMRMAAPGDLRRMLEHQLVRLDTDHVDFYSFHGVGWENFHEIDDRTGWIADMMRARDEGLVRHVAFSFHDKPEGLTKLVDLGMFAAVTCQYNYLDRANADAMQYAREKGLGVVVMGPVGGGRLAGLPGFLRSADGLDTSSAAGLAIRFVLSNPNVHIALSGMGSRKMVDENVLAAETGPLSATDERTIGALLEKTSKLADLYCTGCGYCMPCPQGIDIPARFEAMNFIKVYGLEDHARQQYAAIRERERKTEGKGACTECGACVEKCPQGLDVTGQLKETEAALGAGDA
jgi:predicted aldo/keto reductase-like oxidoreductase